MVVHACNLSMQEVMAVEAEVQVNLGYTGSSNRAWTAEDPVSEQQKTQS